MNNVPREALNIVDYSRQRNMDDQMGHMNKNHVQFIVGCGGVGFWVGVFLAMNGCRRFVVMDGQTIENSNLNRLPVPLRWVGMNKARALKRIIRTLRPDCNVMVLPSHVSQTTMPLLQRVLNNGNVIVWDCTDDARIQTVIYKEVQQKRGMSCRYRKLGYEGFKTGSYSNFDIWFTDEANYRPGYRTSSANAMSSALSACIGIFCQGLGTQRDVKVDFKDLIIAGGTPEEQPVDADDDDEDDEDDDEAEGDDR